MSSISQTQTQTQTLPSSGWDFELWLVQIFCRLSGHPPPPRASRVNHSPAGLEEKSSSWDFELWFVKLFCRISGSPLPIRSQCPATVRKKTESSLTYCPVILTLAKNRRRCFRNRRTPDTIPAESLAEAANEPVHEDILVEEDEDADSTTVVNFGGDEGLNAFTVRFLIVFGIVGAIILWYAHHREILPAWIVFILLLLANRWFSTHL